MAEAIDYFKTQKKRFVDAAQTIIDQADLEGRGLNEEEREMVTKHTNVASDFARQIREVEENAALHNAVAALGAGLQSDVETVEDNRISSVGDAFVKAEGYRALKAKAGGMGRFSIGPVQMPARFFGTSGVVTEDAGDNADMFLPQRVPGIQTPVEAALALAELFGQGTAASNSLLLVRETLTDNNAATVAEGGPKPASNIQFTTETATLAKIATSIKVSSEMLEDETAMATYLNSRLAVFVRQVEEEQLVTQLLSQASQFSDASDIDGDNFFDAILAGATKVETAGGLPADAVVMSPLDFAKMSVIKSSTGGNYFSGGPYASPDSNPWGLRLVKSARLGDGNAVVGAFAQGGAVWRKGGGVTVEATNANEDDFLNNLVAIRAEERMCLFLYRTDAFCIVGQS